MGQRKPEPTHFIPQKSHVKFCVVGDKCALTNEVVKLGQDNFRSGASLKHFIGNAVNFLDIPGNVARDSNEAVEFGNDLIFLKCDRADFNDTMSPLWV